MSGGDLPTASRRAIGSVGYESVQMPSEGNGASARDFYAGLKRDELRRKHNEFSAVATMAREGKL